MPTERTHLGTSEDIFEREIEKRTTFSTVVDNYSSRALLSSRFVCQVAKYLRSKIKMESKKVDSAEKELEHPLPSAPTSPSVLDSSVDVKVCKHATDKHKKTDKLHDDDQ